MATGQSTQTELFPQAPACNRCRRPLPDAAFKICPACRGELNANKNRVRAERKAAGLCLKCAAPAPQGLRHCGSCHAKELARSAEKEARAKRVGRCVVCGKEPEGRKTKCAECLMRKQDQIAAWREQVKAEKRCVVCGRANDRHQRVVCTVCTDKVKAYRIRLKLGAFTAYGGVRCACCGIDYPDFLTIDHIAEDGSAHRKQVAKEASTYRRRSKGWTPKGNGTGVSIYSWLKRHGYPPGFQVLCINCNFAKGHFGSCPHERADPYKAT